MPIEVNGLKMMYICWVCNTKKYIKKVNSQGAVIYWKVKHLMEFGSSDFSTKMLELSKIIWKCLCEKVFCISL